MGLLAKFVLLASVLSAAVIMNIAAAVWSINMLERELSWPLVSMQATLDGLHEVRDDLIELEQSSHLGGITPGNARETLGGVARRLDALDEAFPTRVRIGISTSSNLRGRIQRMAAAVGSWVPGDERAAEAFRGSIDTTVALVGRIERQVIGDASLAVDFGDRLRRRVLWMIVTSALLTLAAIGLSAVFVRRWVLRPVEEIRAGAVRFASGDLGHRVRITSRDQIGRLASDFNTMASTIDRLQSERIERERLAAIGEMLRRVVHNLRTPLAGIRGLAESTGQEVPPGSDIHEMQGRIISAVDRFESWLRELLKSSTPLHVERSPVALEAWINEIVEGRLDAARARSIEIGLIIDPAAPETVEIDADQLAHAAVAVLDNALDATPLGGIVRISITPAESPAAWIIEFSDEGDGIPDEDLKRLFEPSFTTKPRGTGMGLAMTRSIMDAHGGRIEVETRRVDAGGAPGTTFRLLLPINTGGQSPDHVASTGR